MADTKMTKSVGEHWACSELARRGWAPALTRDGLSRTDVLAVGTRLDNRPQIEVQVKSATQHVKPGQTSWELGKVITQFAQSDREWFVLVTIPVDLASTLEGFVLPREHVAAAAHISHTDWLTEDGIPAGQRNAPLSRARVKAQVFAGYRGRWDLLERPASQCPILLPDRYRELAQQDRVGLPEHHPWRENLPDWG